ncbi:MAG: 4Fe-4S binding protein [Deltaproteobacteria bacterium]|nr:4Fe-4S binding protein [Deltaproteobacteria bacterium]
MWNLRRWVQGVATLVSNAYLLFPFTRNIYQGRLKSMCVPGLNCYSCPAASGACPLGSIQSILATVRPSFSSGHYHISFYVLGMLGLIGSLVGRMPCAWVCPFGLIQELIHKIPSRKYEIPQALIYVKYVILVFFVFLLPVLVVDQFGYGMTWFCKYICPAGTLEAGIPMIFLQPSLQELIGILYYNKVIILLVFLILMVFIRRPFCRIACPLGAIYSLFNKVSIFRMVHDPDACVLCKQCYQDCPMGVRFYEGANQVDCIRCLKCYQESCQYGAISIEMAGILLRPVPKKGEKKEEIQA